MTTPPDQGAQQLTEGRRAQHSAPDFARLSTTTWRGQKRSSGSVTKPAVAASGVTSGQTDVAAASRRGDRPSRGPGLGNAARPGSPRSGERPDDEVVVDVDARVVPHLLTGRVQLRDVGGAQWKRVLLRLERRSDRIGVAGLVLHLDVAAQDVGDLL